MTNLKVTFETMDDEGQTLVFSEERYQLDNQRLGDLVGNALVAIRPRIAGDLSREDFLRGLDGAVELATVNWRLVKSSH